MIPNSQYLIDGALWAIHDHPNWAMDAWLVVQNHLKDTGTRYEELRRELRNAKAVAAEEDPTSKTNRERLYRAHAAVQDLYLAFCVVDALLKSEQLHLSRDTPSVKEAVEKELPHLVADYVPLFEAQHSEWAEDAAEEYRDLFFHLLRSWLTQQVLREDTHRRMEEFIRHKLKTNREAMEVAKAPFAASAATDGLRLLIRTTNAAATGSSKGAGRGPPARAAGPGGRGGGPQQPRRTPDSVERTIRSFLASIFPAKKGATGRFRCPHCGAYFKDDKSKNAHYRCHFTNHNFLKPEEKVVRLMYPSVNDFIEHTGDVERSGYFAKATDVLEDAYRNGERGVMKARRLESS